MLVQLLVTPVVLPILLIVGVIYGLPLLLYIACCERRKSVCPRFVLMSELLPFSIWVDWYWVPLWKGLMASKEEITPIFARCPKNAAFEVTPTGYEAPEQKPGWVRVVVVSDTHGKHRFVDVPACDLVIHCGDALSRNSKLRWLACSSAEGDMRDVVSWLESLPCKRAVLVPGNHDGVVEGERSESMAEWQSSVLKYVHHLGFDGEKVGLCVCEAFEACGIVGFGIPFSPASRSPNSAFQVKKVKLDYEVDPSKKTRIVAAHSSHGKLFRKAVAKLDLEENPFIVCGHFHEDYGVDLSGAYPVLNASICDGSYRPIRPPIIVDVEI